MISGFNITPDEWQQTASTVRIAAVWLQHQLYILNARFTAYQQQNSTLSTKVEQFEQIKDKQKAEIERLEQYVIQLKERLRQNSANSSLPPSSDSPFGEITGQRQLSGCKQGAQPGHTGVGRRLLSETEVDKIIDLYPEQCANCGALLLGEDCTPTRRQLIELANGQAFVTEYRRHRLRCLVCHRLNRPEWSRETEDGGVFGASVKAMVGYLTGRLNLSHRDTAEALLELFNLKMALGSISALQRRVSTALAEPVTQALEFVQQQTSQSVDETGWKEKGKLNWLWVNCTEKVTVFQLQNARTQTAAQIIIDEQEIGVITTDRYPGYNFLQGWRRQICWAHLKRDFTAIAEREEVESKEIGEQLLTETKKMFELFNKVRDGTLPHNRLRPLIEPVKTQVKKLLEIGSRIENAKTAGVCRHILKLNRSLWTFVRVAEVEPTNNRAERALRRAVLWRRKSFGTQSQLGSRFVERILTVVATLRQQRRSVLDYLKTACAIKMTVQNIPELNLQSH